MTSPDQPRAKDIATHLGRQRRRRRLLALAVIIAAVILAILYLRCGRGLGGKRAGTGKGTASAAHLVAIDAGPSRCMVRVTASGITVDGKASSREAAVTACKRTTGAEVVITGDARQGDWDELRTALEEAGVEIFTKQR